MIGANTNRRMVYDIPTRLFHWFFAGLFITAFLIAKTIDDESPVFSYHMLAGFLLSFIVLLRIIWGFVGTRYARFNSFALNPKDLVNYFTGIISGSKLKWSGHNPASSWAGLVMMVLALSLGTTGYLMANGQKETFEDVHELLANGFLVVVLMHIAGVILHMLRHRDALALSMIVGTKSDVPEQEAISNSKPAVALLFVGLVTTFAVHLASNFDMQKRTLNFFGTTLQLGETEEEEKSEQKDSGGNHDTREDKEENEDD